MATGYVDPNGDGSTLEWSPIGGGSHYVEVDDGTRSPTAPDTANYISAAGTGNGTRTDELHCGTIASVSSVSSVKIYIYASTAGSGAGGASLKCNINMGGWQTEQTVFSGSQSAGWFSVTFNGTWTQSDLDGLQIRLAHVRTLGLVAACTVYAVYGEITYTAGGGSPQTVEPERAAADFTVRDPGLQHVPERAEFSFAVSDPGLSHGVAVVSRINLDPTGDGTTQQWAFGGTGTGHYTSVDDGVRDPSPNVDGAFVRISSTGSIGQQWLEEFTFDQPATAEDVLSVTLRVNGYCGVYSRLDAQLYIDGQWTSPVTLMQGFSILNWHTARFTGQWTAAQLSDLRVRLVAVKIGGTLPGDVVSVTVESLYLDLGLAGGGMQFIVRDPGFSQVVQPDRASMLLAVNDATAYIVVDKIIAPSRALAALSVNDPEAIHTMGPERATLAFTVNTPATVLGLFEPADRARWMLTVRDPDIQIGLVATPERAVLDVTVRDPIADPSDFEIWYSVRPGIFGTH